MSRILTALTAITFGLGLQQNLLSQQAIEYNPKVGQRHPEFIMPSIADDAPIKLSDFAGKKVLLINFASW